MSRGEDRSFLPMIKNSGCGAPGRAACWRQGICTRSMLLHGHVTARRRYRAEDFPLRSERAHWPGHYGCHFTTIP
jgi:hypothetical protein